MDKSGEENEPPKIVEAEPLTWKFWKKKRYVIVLLVFLGYCNIYASRVNLSVAIVAMTGTTQTVDANGNIEIKQEFYWSSKEKGVLLSSFFYGYIFTQFIGGYIAAAVGAKWVFTFAIFFSSILTLITPAAAKLNFTFLVCVRLLLGMCQGVTFPAVHAIWSRWSPPLERSRMAQISFSGNFVGTVLTLPIAGNLAASFGWPSIFYVIGVVGILYSFIFHCLVQSGPELDRCCSKAELEYIQASLGNRKGSGIVKHPWKSIFTSKPVWAIMISHCTHNWGFYTLLTELPSYLKEPVNFNLNEVGIMSALPYLAMGIFLNISGFLADWVQVKGYMTTTEVRRNFNSGAYFFQAICMLMSIIVLDKIWSVVIITACLGVGAFAWSGFAVNQLDIAPPHASVLMGISNTFATVPGMISPVLTGFIVQNRKQSEYGIVFAICAAIYVAGGLIYCCWASGKLQDWSYRAEAIEPKKPEKL